VLDHRPYGCALAHPFAPIPSKTIPSPIPASPSAEESQTKCVVCEFSRERIKRQRSPLLSLSLSLSLSLVLTISIAGRSCLNTRDLRLWFICVPLNSPDQQFICDQYREGSARGSLVRDVTSGVTQAQLRRGNWVGQDSRERLRRAFCRPGSAIFHRSSLWRFSPLTPARHSKRMR